MSKLDEIESYLSKMTPGEWMVEKREYDSSIHYCIRTVEKLPQHPWSARLIAFFAGSLGEKLPSRKPEDYRDDPEIENDAEGIARLRTDAEYLVRRCEALEKALRGLCDSMVPHPKEHPTMFAAKSEAERVLKQE